MRNPSSYPPPQFVEAELRRSGISMKISGGSAMIVCPYHRDVNPSLSVALTTDRVPPGVHHCFACEAKGAWNKLAKHLGLRLWNSNGEDNGEAFVRRNRVELINEAKKDGYVFKDWTDAYTWKTYKKDFLEKFDAKLVYDTKYRANYLYLPISYLNEDYGCCKVRLNKDDPGPKYWFSAGMRKSMYPIDYVSSNFSGDCVCLVEGIADAFRCIQHGIPALALLGVEITPFMEEQLGRLAVNNIVLCLDGDEAGVKAMKGTPAKKGLYHRLRKLGYGVKMAVPPDKSDPDSMPKKYVLKLKDICDKMGARR